MKGGADLIIETGIAHYKGVAKLCSSKNKPNKQVTAERYVLRDRVC